jgi:hypothetical protein
MSMGLDLSLYDFFNFFMGFGYCMSAFKYYFSLIRVVLL